MSETQSCEVCGTLSDYWVSINKYKHFKCRYCGHIFVYPKPSQKVLDSIYQEGNYYNSADAQQFRLQKEAQKRLNILDRLRQQFQLTKTLLDVGCAKGCFLSVAKESGWNVTGIDRSDTIAQEACLRSGVKVVQGIFEDNEVPGAPFPVVTAWEVLEHAVDPESFFSALSQNVAPEGILAISTPLANGFPAKLLGARFPMLTPPEHLSIFTRKSLGILAAKFEYEEIYYSSFSNLGFKSVAAGASKYIFRKNLPSSSNLTKSMFNILGLGSAWLPVLMDLLGYGTEMQVIFKRKQLSL